jgi:hypothetical protein
MTIIAAAAANKGRALEGRKMSVSTAVVSWTPGTHLRVYKTDGKTVTEKCWDGSGPWYTGAFSSPGQGVSGTAWVDPELHIRLYITDGSKVVEHCWDGGGPWYVGAYPS